MSFDVLLAQPAIGWDFDGTLIDHPASEAMHAFILAHPEKRHVIVTFRTHGMERRIWRELAQYPGAPRSENFVGILNIEDEAWEAHNTHTIQRQIGRLSGPPTKEELYYVEWKGMVCHRHGLTALVDDNIPHTISGCEKHGIILIDPNDL